MEKNMIAQVQENPKTVTLGGIQTPYVIISHHDDKFSLPFLGLHCFFK